MFTGLIREIGTLVRRGEGALVIACPGLRPVIAVGDSIAVNGVCLTARALSADGFEADVSPETFARSTLGGLRPGSRINLEPALAVGERLGGHIVQGHVDGVGSCAAIRSSGEGFEVRFNLPAPLSKYVAGKGSIAVDGVSLTVASLDAASFSVAVIPHTWAATTLQFLRAGDAVNLEVDILAKYVERLLDHDAGRPPLTEAFLRDHGFAI
jgi:riboflavin synthase